MKFSVLIPVISLNFYSERVLSSLHEKILSFPDIEFVVIVSNSNIRSLVLQLFALPNPSANFKLYIANSLSSNYLRKYAALKATCTYSIYQDCDDEINYNFLLRYYLSNENILLTILPIISFNIKRLSYDNNSLVVQEKVLYNNKNYNNKLGCEISHIEHLPKNIVAKLIPTFILRTLDFSNLPFTQDWFLSYQLFLLKQHYFYNDIIYLYHNYPDSSAHVKHTKFYGLKRVLIAKKMILRLYQNCANRDSYNYINFHYEVLLVHRFAHIGFFYFPHSPFGLTKDFLHFNFLLLFRKLYNITKVFKVLVVLKCKFSTRYFSSV